jgi:hypothetical protein
MTNTKSAGTPSPFATGRTRTWRDKEVTLTPNPNPIPYPKPNPSVVVSFVLSLSFSFLCLEPCGVSLCCHVSFLLYCVYLYRCLCFIMFCLCLILFHPNQASSSISVDSTRQVLILSCIALPCFCCLVFISPLSCLACLCLALPCLALSFSRLVISLSFLTLLTPAALILSLTLTPTFTL